eukprot:6597089-Karenia_brevis.AAC.1
MRHCHISEALRQRGVDSGVRALLLQELIGVKATMYVPGAGATSGFEFQCGGRQGGVETPDEFNALLEAAFGELIASWTSRGYGILLEPFGLLHHAIWADNIILLAASVEQMTTMTTELTHTLHSWDLLWKPSSLKVMLS